MLRLLKWMWGSCAALFVYGLGAPLNLSPGHLECRQGPWMLNC